MIVDEVQTGLGGAGKMWAHEHWNLDSNNAPDIVTFAKKCQLGGFFFKDKLEVEGSYRLFNTWLGEPTKLVLLSTIIDVIKRDNLLEQTTNVGNTILNGLKDLANGMHT